MQGTNIKITMFYTHTHTHTHTHTTHKTHTHICMYVYIYTCIVYTNLYNGNQISFRGNKQLWGSANYTSASSAEVKNWCSYNSTFPLCLQWHVTEWPSILHMRFIFVTHEMVEISTKNHITKD